jgi:DNA-binding MarR family transcriptional regulator
MPTTETADRNDAAALTEDAAEIRRLLSATMLDLKRSGAPPAAIRTAVQHADLGKRHAPALLAIVDSGPMSVSELAARLGAQLTTTSTVVGELSRAGLVERSEDENDRRRTIVRVHGDYSDELKAWLEVATAPIRNTLGRLSPTARKGFMEGWRLLHEEAEKAAVDGDREDCPAGAH